MIATGLNDRDAEDSNCTRRYLATASVRELTRSLYGLGFSWFVSKQFPICSIAIKFYKESHHSATP
jgi:hypothetical protein